ncbi:MAG: hypothetical protein Q9191_008389, partial [Dirinaria sp. TL-2023a]
MAQPVSTQSEPRTSKRLSDHSEDLDNDVFAAALSQDEADSGSEGNIPQNFEEDLSEDGLLSDEGSFSDDTASERADDTAGGEKFDGTIQEVMEDDASARNYTITQDANGNPRYIYEPIDPVYDSDDSDAPATTNTIGNIPL